MRGRENVAFYDKMTGKKKDPRNDWRDDEKTHRPQRDMVKDDEKKPVKGAWRPSGERTEKTWQKHEPDSHGKGMGRGPRQERNGYEESSRGMPHRETYRGKNESGTSRKDGYRPNSQEIYGWEERRSVERGVHEPAQMHEQEAENLLVGRNPIREALKTGRDMEKLLVAKGELMGSAREIVAMAREQHVVIQEVDRARLDAMAPNHQGMIAVVSAYAYHTLEDIFALAAERKQEPFIVMLDGITDPHNLGAVIRSAECAGAHGVIIPSRRAVGLTPSAVKASAGAVEHIPVVRETNLSRTLETLKKEGCWVFGTSMNGKNYRNADYSGPVVLVIGSEGEGISKLVSEHCDDMVTIPLYGKIDSLNASVAAGIILFAIAEKRGGK